MCEILTVPLVVAQPQQLYLMFSISALNRNESHRPAIFVANALIG